MLSEEKVKVPAIVPLRGGTIAGYPPKVPASLRNCGMYVMVTISTTYTHEQRTNPVMDTSGDINDMQNNGMSTNICIQFHVIHAINVPCIQVGHIDRTPTAAMKQLEKPLRRCCITNVFC